MKASTFSEPINLHCFQEEFWEAIRRHVHGYCAHFGERLVAIYVFGSVHRNEAVFGISDLDLHPFITGTLDETDEEWFQRVGDQLDREFPVTCGLCRPHSVEARLLKGMQPEVDENARAWSRAVLFRLCYDATLAWGRDVIEGLPIPPPDRLWARGHFQSSWDLTRYAAGSEKENRTDFDLPDEPSLRLRKLARLAVIGGAYLLMACGEFRSYRGADVIPSLDKRFPQWSTFLNETRALYIRHVSPTAEQVSAYLSKLVTWMDWIGGQLK